MSDPVTGTNLNDAVICRLDDGSPLSDAAYLANLGFTVVLLPPEELTDQLLDEVKYQPLHLLPSDIVPEASVATSLNKRLETLATGSPTTAADVWKAYESTSSGQHYSEVDLSGMAQEPGIKISLMVRLALTQAPVIAFGARPRQLSRELAEYLRSLIFWRKRYQVSRLNPRLVHTGDDGTLIFVLDSWLVAINGSDEEISIDIGSGGAMWLMLATHQDVHLHGSLLLLPAYGGAILANELAR